MAKMNWDKVRSTNSYVKYRDQETVYSYDKKRDGESSRIVGVYKIDPETGERKPVESKPKRTTNGSKKKNNRRKSNSKGPVITAKNLQKGVNAPFCIVIHANSNELEKLKTDIKRAGHSYLVKQLVDINESTKNVIRETTSIFVKCGLDYYSVITNHGEKAELLYSGVAVDISALRLTNIKKRVFEQYDELYSKRINSSYVEIYKRKQNNIKNSLQPKHTKNTEISEPSGPSTDLMLYMNPDKFWEFENAVKFSGSITFQCSAQFMTPKILPQKINNLIITNNSVAYVYSHIERYVNISLKKKRVSIGINLSLPCDKKAFKDIGDYSVFATGTDKIWSGIASIIERK